MQLCSRLAGAYNPHTAPLLNRCCNPCKICKQMSPILSIKKQLLPKTLMNRVYFSLHYVQTCHRCLPYSVMHSYPLPIIHIWHPCHHDRACKMGPLHISAQEMTMCLCGSCHDPLCSQGQSCQVSCMCFTSRADLYRSFSKSSPLQHRCTTDF